MERKPGPGEVFEGNDRYEGYCAELAQLISRHMNINYKLKLVNDSDYGAYSPDSAQGWNGMIGELIRGVCKPYFAIHFITHFCKSFNVTFVQNWFILTV